MRARLISVVLALLVTAEPALARDPATPEERIHRLERQVREMRRTVYPKGEPADTEGFSEAPAASKETVDSLTARLDAIEHQMSELVRAGEENTHRLGVVETDIARLRADQETRLRAIEGGAPVAAPRSGDSDAAPRAPRDEPTTAPPPPPPATGPANFEAAGEAAYTQGFDLWTAKKYDQAITRLRAMASSFPGHRRVSWANNLVGRALLDKGQPRAAAEALLANYRGDPKGERASDSLFYLGQSLVKLGQSAQACKAYDELNDVYGATMRPQLKAMIPAARRQAQCS